MCHLFFLILMLGLNSNLFSGVENHLVKITNKSDGQLHQIRNIDFIYMINLDRRPEKFEQSAVQLNPFGVYPFRFPAIYGKKLTLEQINDLGVKLEPWMTSGQWGTSYLDESLQPVHDIVHVLGRNYFCHCMGRGPIAIVLSHLSVLQDAYDSGYKTIWVMEDDIQVLRDPNLLSGLIDKLDKLVEKKWDILFTDKDTKNNRGEYVPCLGYAWRPNFAPQNPGRFAEQKIISPDFKKVGARYGAYSMIVRRSGMKKILKFIKKHQIFLPYDMEFYLPNDIKMYAVNEDIISTLPQALSDNN